MKLSNKPVYVDNETEEYKIKNKGPVTDEDVQLSAIAIKMNSFLMNPTARGGNLGAIYPAVKQIVDQLREMDSSKHETGVAVEDKIALTVSALVKDGILHSNSYTVHLFYGLFDFEKLSDETIETIADNIYEFATTGYEDEERKSNNKYGKMFWYPVTELEKLGRADLKILDYVRNTKSLDGNLKIDEIHEMKELHKNDNVEELMKEIVENHIKEYKEMNRLPEVERDRACPDCGSNDITDLTKAKKSLFSFGKRKTFKCNKCGISW